MLDLGITYGDLGLIVLFVMAVIIGFFFIRILASISGSAHALKKLICNNADNLDLILKDLPTLSENAVVLSDQATEIAEALIGEQEMIDRALENVGDTIELVADTARSVNNDIVGGIKKLVGVIAALVGFASKRKEAAEAKAEAKAEARAAAENMPEPEAPTGSAVHTDSAGQYHTNPNESAVQKENVSLRVKGRRNRLDEDRPGRREKRAAAAARRNAALAKKREASAARRGQDFGKRKNAGVAREKDTDSREQVSRAWKANDKVRDININIR